MTISLEDSIRLSLEFGHRWQRPGSTYLVRVEDVFQWIQSKTETPSEEPTDFLEMAVEELRAGDVFCPNGTVLWTATADAQYYDGNGINDPSVSVPVVFSDSVVSGRTWPPTTVIRYIYRPNAS